ncbi:conserved hypothetical protein [Xenorhabdus nematophila str. Anatoliense]|nr:conserved hypothetical protein [Xenorhabdus nematophila str. Anatoliense]
MDSGLCNPQTFCPFPLIVIRIILDIDKERFITDFSRGFITRYTGFYFVAPPKQGADSDFKVDPRLFERQRMLVFVCQNPLSKIQTVSHLALSPVI